jgi:ribonuclease HI
MGKFIERVKIYIDGCCKGNPGPSAVGIVIVDDEDNILREIGKHIEEGTNQEAEYRALIEAFEILPDICTLDIIIHSDSQLVIKQMNRQYRIHKKHLLKPYEKARQKKNIFRKVEYYHVPRNNKWIKKADKLASNALNSFLSGE